MPVCGLYNMRISDAPFVKKARKITANFSSDKFFFQKNAKINDFTLQISSLAAKRMVMPVFSAPRATARVGYSLIKRTKRNRISRLLDRRLIPLVEHRRLELLTSTMPLLRSTRWASTPVCFRASQSHFLTNATAKVRQHFHPRKKNRVFLPFSP